MSDAVSDELSVGKIGCRVAATIEEMFAAAGAQAGDYLGSEEALCRRFGVSRRIYREAVRVLTMRGTAELRRGPNAGLVMAAPDVDVVVDVLRGYAFLVGINEEHRRGALAFLDRLVPNLAGNADTPTRKTVAFMRRFIGEQLTPGMPPEGLVMRKFRKSRAGQIALRVLEEHMSKAFVPGRRVASEQQLSQQYNADRSITRQAIRLLESAGLISSVPGRGNGLYTTRPPSGPVCRLLCCHFSALHLSVPAAFTLFELVNVQLVALLSERADHGGVERVLRLMTWKTGGSLLLRDIIAVEDGLVAELENPLLDLMFRTVRGFVAPTIAQFNVIVPPQIASCFDSHTRQLLGAIARHDTDAAISAQQRKLFRMRELEKVHHPHLARELYG